MAQYINLYDPDLLRKRDWLALHVVVGGTLALIVIVGALGFLARSDLPALDEQVANGEARLKAIRDQITVLGQKSANLKPSVQLEQSLVAERARLAMRGEILATLRQRLGPEVDSFSAYLHGLSAQSVPGLWLTAFSVDTARGTMEIRGSTLDPALLPEYIRRLNHEKAFRGRSFAALKMDKTKPAAPPATPPATDDAANAPTVAPTRAHHEFMLTPAPETSAGKAQNMGTPTAGGNG